MWQAVNKLKIIIRQNCINFIDFMLQKARLYVNIYNIYFNWQIHGLYKIKLFTSYAGKQC